MNKNSKKTLLSLSIIALISYEPLTIAADSGAKTLGNAVGKVDRYKANCPTGTTHLDFKLLDSTLSASTNTNTTAPQLFNAHLKKGTAIGDATGIVANSSKEMTIKGGNGVYTLTLDTFGTNAAITNAQSYTVQYRCLNADGKSTTPTLTSGFKAGIDSPLKTLKNNSKATLTFNCVKNAKLGSTEKLYLKITNKTKAPTTITKTPVISTTSPFLTAQLYNLNNQIATSATDVAGDDNYGDTVSLNAGAGDYYFIVTTTATDSTKDNAKTYAFQYSCLNDANVEQPATLSQLQDN